MSASSTVWQSPITLLAPAALAAGQQPQWFAVQTHARHEKKIAAELQWSGVTTFLPLVGRIHHWSDRRKLVELPLFPSYLFVHIPVVPEIQIRILHTSGVLQFVGTSGRGTPIPEWEVNSIRKLLASNVGFEPWGFLKLGQRVRIRGGCLDGVEGVLLAQNKDRRLVISVGLIQKSLAISVEGYDVEPA